MFPKRWRIRVYFQILLLTIQGDPVNNDRPTYDLRFLDDDCPWYDVEFSSRFDLDAILKVRQCNRLIIL